MLCSDKTGTLTEGKRLDGALMSRAQPGALQLAAINAAFQTGFHNPIDDTIVAAAAAHGRASHFDEFRTTFAAQRASQAR